MRYLSLALAPDLQRPGAMPRKEARRRGREIRPRDAEGLNTTQSSNGSGIELTFTIQRQLTEKQEEAHEKKSFTSFFS